MLLAYTRASRATATALGPGAWRWAGGGGGGMGLGRDIYIYIYVYIYSEKERKISLKYEFIYKRYHGCFTNLLLDTIGFQQNHESVTKKVTFDNK